MNDDSWCSRLIERPRWHVGVEQRSCRLHPAIRAGDCCDSCGEPYCAACLQEVERWRVCAGHAQGNRGTSGDLELFQGRSERSLKHRPLLASLCFWL